MHYTNRCTSEPSVSPTIISYPASASPLRAAAALGTLSIPHPSPTNTPPNPYKTGVILGSISIVVVAIATIISLAFYFTCLWKKCGCRGYHSWHRSRRAGRRIVIDLDASAEGVESLEAGDRGVVEAFQSPRLADGESSLVSPAWVGRSARESIPNGARWQGPPSVAVFEGFYPYPYVVPTPERSQTTRHVQPVAALPDTRHRSSDYEQQRAMEIPPTARPARNQRQKLRSDKIPFISSPMPLKRSRVGGTSWGLDPRSTSPPSPNLTRQLSYNPPVTPTERNRTHISTGTSNSPEFDVRASGMAQPAKAPPRKVIKKPDSAPSVFPTSPGQKPPRSLPTLFVTGPDSSQPAQSTADSPRAPTRTSTSESPTTHPTELRAGEPSGSNQLPPSYDYVATSRMRGSASDKVGGLDEELFVYQP